jgi:hypothetical protein
MRDTAETQYGFQSDNAKELKPQLAASQKLVDTIADIKAELAKGPSSFDRKAWAGLKARYAAAKDSYVTAIGDKNVSSRNLSVADDALDFDPSSMTSRVASRGKAEAALDVVSQDATSAVDSKLKAEKYRGTWQLKAHQGDGGVDTIGDKTSIEAGEDAEPGVLAGVNPVDSKDGPVAKAGREASRFVFGDDGPSDVDPEDPVQVAENSHPSGPTGLSPKDTGAVVGLIGRYNAANDAERGKILTTLTAYAQSPRASIANGTIGLLRNNPEIYQQVLSVLPTDQQAQLKQTDAAVRAAQYAPGYRPIQLHSSAPPEAVLPQGVRDFVTGRR